MQLVDLVAQSLGQAVHFRLQIDQGAVPHADQRGQSAALDLVGDVRPARSVGYGTDAVRIGQRGGNLGRCGVRQVDDGVVDQWPAGLGEDDEGAVGPLEGAYVDVPGDLG